MRQSRFSIVATGTAENRPNNWLAECNRYNKWAISMISTLVQVCQSAKDSLSVKVYGYIIARASQRRLLLMAAMTQASFKPNLL